MIARKGLVTILGVALLCAVLSRPLSAQTPPPSPNPAASVHIEGVTVTSQDIAQLYAAFKLALKPNDKTIPIVVVLKPAGDMPAYDKDWHYDGMRATKNGTKTMYAWINQSLTGIAMQNAIAAATLLAITDGGYAGAAFKQLYDIYAAEDAQLPPSAPDPYLNRHRFADALVRVTSMNPSPSP